MAIVNSIAAIIYEVERIVIHFYYNSIRTQTNLTDKKKILMANLINATREEKNV